MHARRPRDFTRFEREMRVWGRRFARDMEAMGAQMARDAEAAGKTGRHGDWFGAGAAWGFGDEYDDAWSDDWGCGRRRRTRRASEAHASGDAEHAAERRAEEAAWRAERAARRAERSSSRDSRREQRRKSCGSGGGWWWMIFCFWWLVFPLYGLLQDIGRDLRGGVGALGGAIDGLVMWTFEHSLAGPVAGLMASSAGVTFLQAFGVLALAGAISAAVAWFGLRRPLPAR